MTEQPRWRRAYDELDRTLTPHVESLVHSDGFLREVARLNTLRSTARRQLTAVTGRVWHLVNLPASSDLSRLASQVGALDREVRRLTLQLEQQTRPARAGTQSTVPSAGESAGAHDAESAGSARPRPSRRRAQRPEGP